MEARGISITELERRSGVHRGELGKLRAGKWVSIKREAMQQLLAVLQVDLGELFVAFPDDIWTPIRIAREVTIHFGSNSLPEVGPDRGARRGGHALREVIGYWDLRAFFVIGEHVSKLGVDVNLQFQAHASDVQAAEHESVDQVFARGNHIILGSPQANVLAEEVVSRAYGVRPFASSADSRGAFPYHFVWDSHAKRVSSFATRGKRSAMGIASTRTNQLVARRTLVAHGEEGEDCALIVVHRLGGHGDGAPGERDRTGDTASGAERIVMTILGHSGPGTLAGAEVAVQPTHGAQLYPATSTQPRMRVVCATYVRQAPGPRDSRKLTGRWLYEDDQSNSVGQSGLA